MIIISKNKKINNIVLNKQICIDLLYKNVSNFFKVSNDLSLFLDDFISKDGYIEFSKIKSYSY